MFAAVIKPITDVFKNLMIFKNHEQILNKTYIANR